MRAAAEVVDSPVASLEVHWIVAILFFFFNNNNDGDEEKEKDQEQSKTLEAW